MTHTGCGFPRLPASDFASSKIKDSLLGFEELAIPLFDSLYNFARWLAPNRTDAEDLVQETFLKALRGFSSFEHQFPCMDLQDSEEYLPEFALDTGISDDEIGA